MISFDAPVLDTFDGLPETTKLLNKAFCDTIERFLVKAITAMEGHPPVLEDVKRFGSRNLFPGGKQEITYRGVPIVIIPPYPITCEDGRIVFEIRVNKLAMQESVVK